MNCTRKQYFPLAQRMVKVVCAPEHINITEIEDGTNNGEQFILAVSCWHLTVNGFGFLCKSKIVL